MLRLVVAVQAACLSGLMRPSNRPTGRVRPIGHLRPSSPQHSIGHRRPPGRPEPDRLPRSVDRARPIVHRRSVERAAGSRRPDRRAGRAWWRLDRLRIHRLGVDRLGAPRFGSPRAGISEALQRGQATAEYALVLLGVAAVALLLAAWATKSGKIGQLFDKVIGELISRA